MSEPTVSVVVAAGLPGGGLPDCLAALGEQRAAILEVLVVSCAPAEIREDHSWMRWVPAASDLLVPQLWSLGIAAAQGEVVALTTEHCEPAIDWVAQVRTAHARTKAPAIGGPVDPPRAGLLAWATYFLRYSAYLNYDREQTVPDLAADNGSYKRAAVQAYPEFVNNGFWEQELHARFRRHGQDLVFVPTLRVRLTRSFGFVPFLWQRLRHGRQFGRARMSGRPVVWRMSAIAGSPLIPLILLAKLGLRVWRSRRDRGRFVASLPVLSTFALAWSVGEASAYISPGPRTWA